MSIYLLVVGDGCTIFLHITQCLVLGRSGWIKKSGRGFIFLLLLKRVLVPIPLPPVLPLLLPLLLLATLLLLLTLLAVLLLLLLLLWSRFYAQFQFTRRGGVGR